MDWKLLLLVSLASGLGGGARYVLHALSTIGQYPTGTLVVNVLGCFLIGLLVFGGIAGGWMSPNTRIVVGLGLLGGFTTMSAFTFDTLALMENGEHAIAAGNIIATVILSLVATWLGRATGIAIWTGSH